jgi:hypothetical protein
MIFLNLKVFLLALVLCCCSLSGCAPDEFLNYEEWAYTELKNECGKMGKGGCRFGIGNLCEGDTYLYIGDGRLATLVMSKKLCESPFVESFNSNTPNKWFSSSDLQ